MSSARIFKLSCALLVVSTLRAFAADAEVHYWPGWYGCNYKVANVRAVVTYSGTAAGQTVCIQRELDNGGVFCFTATGPSGVYHSAATGYTANCGGSHDPCNLVNWTAVAASINGSNVDVTVSGGRWVTGQVIEDPCGPSCCPANTANNVDMAYTVSKQQPNFTWNYGILNGCSEPATYQLVLDGFGTVATHTEQGSGNPCIIPFGGSLSYNWTPATNGVGFTVLLNSVAIHSGVTHDVENEALNHDQGNFDTCNNMPCGQPTPTPTPTPGPSPTPQPSPTPTATPPTAPPAPTAPPPQTYPTAPPGTTPTVYTNPGGGNANLVIVANPQDIYGPIVDAITGQGESEIAQPVITPDFNTGATPPPVLQTNHAERDWQLKQAQDSMETAVDSGKLKLTNLEPLVFPSVSSGDCSWPVTLPVLGTFTVHMGGPNMGPIRTIFRNLVLITFIIGAWFGSVRIIRSAIS